MTNLIFKCEHLSTSVVEKPLTPKTTFYLKIALELWTRNYHSITSNSISEHLQNARQEEQRTRSEISQRAQKNALLQVVFKEAQAFKTHIQAFHKRYVVSKDMVFHVFDVIFKAVLPAQPLISKWPGKKSLPLSKLIWNEGS